MISIEDLKKYKEFTNFNLGQSEKYLYQNILLFIIYKEFGNELIFKGGTALTKCYGLNRFSEDLDFTQIKEIKNITNLISNQLKKLNILFEIKEIKNNEQAQKLKILIQGPTYTGSRQSLCSISIDISKREKILFEPNIINIKTLFLPIPGFDVVVMNLKEIFAEKIRAIMTRNQARDVYDLYNILEHQTNMAFINEKLTLYQKSFSLNEFETCLEEKKAIWDVELKNLMINYPLFDEVKSKILTSIKTIK
ncbi:MAG: nucleotidyl transferase AbiEii/AbiGii toxin family protein [Candidatus Nanoarchaeia archaeon]|nr:nucleotidyl transferase AbiEii/AbiGii toxin family protein [Candidatus Nanoarchaeia archaeon]